MSGPHTCSIAWRSADVVKPVFIDASRQGNMYKEDILTLQARDLLEGSLQAMGDLLLVLVAGFRG